jgi:shikimate dehydrogenase
MEVTGAARTAGVVGWPVEHSLSPRLHGFWLRRYGLDGLYAPLPVRADGFETAVRGLAAAGFSGVNVTVPHKLAALAIADRADAAARAVGAANTLVFSGDGVIEARNTDAYGFIANLRQSAVDGAAGPVVVLGAGGAARAAVFALLQAGAPSVGLINRTADRAQALIRDLGDHRLTYLGPTISPNHLKNCALLVNTTILGMTGADRLDIDLSVLPDGAVVHDIVYVPLRTPLLETAARRGLRTVDGLGMLLHQAAPAFEAFFGRRPEVTRDLREHLLEVL